MVQNFSITSANMLGNRARVVVWLGVLAGACTSSIAPMAHAQLTINYVFDQQEIDAVFPDSVRRGKMVAASAKVAAWFASTFPTSSVSYNHGIRWVAPAPGATFAATDVRSYPTDWTTARVKLAESADSAAESALYDALPTSSVPYVWELTDSTAAPRQATSILATYPLFVELGIMPSPQVPSAQEMRTLFPPANYAFYPGKLPTGYTRFTAILAHETIHALGFQSSGDLSGPFGPGGRPRITVMDIFRLRTAMLPASSTLVSSGVREVRLGEDASFVTRLQSSTNNGAYRLASGLSTPTGDGFQMSHFKAAQFLTPQVPIGIMDPNSSNSVAPQSARDAQVTRADLEVLDVIGWNINPATANLMISGVQPEQIVPAEGAIVRASRLFFTWEDTQTNSASYSINIFSVDPSLGGDIPEPLTFESILGTTFTLPTDASLTPGSYWWEVVGVPLNYFDGYSSGWRGFTVACPADFAGPGQSTTPDGDFTADDIIVFLNLFFAGNPDADVAGPGQSTTPDGNFTADDIIVFLNLFFARC